MNFQTPYELLGGEETIQNLVNAFYPKVYADPILSPLFVGDMEEIKRKQKMFLTQFTGGPTLYSNEFGPPAMRARHLPFEITPTRAKAWLACMREAMNDIGLEGPMQKSFYERLEQVAGIMINTPD
ncbi:globin [Schinkia sp. CFF1]